MVVANFLPEPATQARARTTGRWAISPCSTLAGSRRPESPCASTNYRDIPALPANAELRGDVARSRIPRG